MLNLRAEQHPERIALYCLADGTGAETCYSYAELDLQARALAAELQTVSKPGERVMLCLANDFSYVVGFFGCLYAGLIAVPAYVPDMTNPQSSKRVLAIAQNAQPSVLLTVSTHLNSLQTLAEQIHASVMTIDTLALDRASAWLKPTIKDDDIAFLQYTSGSTAEPKGVIIGHDNLMANERAIKQGFAITEQDVFVSWLPLFHDMGLVGGLLQPLFSGIPVVLMSPRYFLERPVRWLEAVSHYRGTVSGGPDFAFRLCNERIRPAQLEGLDLTSWRLAFCGAEPIRVANLTTFAERLAATGLPKTAPYPCYGLAEATLLVTGGAPSQALTTTCFNTQDLAAQRVQPADSGVELVGCGHSQLDHTVLIISATGQPAGLDEVGEICLSGPSISRGYWRNPEATAAVSLVYEGQHYLRTGDLGFIHTQHLYLAGRSKDLILIRGHNVYPQDVEQALEDQCPGLRKGRVAAFAIEHNGQEAIAIAAEIGRGEQKKQPATAWFDVINRIVAETCQRTGAAHFAIKSRGIAENQ
ncbi:AMP-binding protein [Methylocucumis oryzae]|uniref:AMP-binding protein n=1 Tax=Methylocucumis oryzae TaxID=1632867 RepID=UPI000697DBE1|nr:AMP-binding protein [Methylocucumis oryzae]